MAALLIVPEEGLGTFCVSRVIYSNSNMQIIDRSIKFMIVNI